jgi:DNA recombination protein RmuC
MDSAFVIPVAAAVAAVLTCSVAFLLWRISALKAADQEKSALESKLADRAARLEETSGLVGRLREELGSAESALVKLRAEHAALQETLDQVRHQAEEKLSLLREARDQMTNEFKLLAQEIMTQHGERFKKQNVEQLAGILEPLREKLLEFQQGLSNAHTESAKERATLAEQIRALSAASAKMSNETENLTQALKGKSHVQGAWGEMLLKSILERSGLREGEEYVMQESRFTEEGARLRPDAIVTLPGGHQQVVIDSKVSLTAFAAYVNAETDSERSVQLALHLNSIRAHIKALSEKEYQQVISSELNFVIMFVPIEGALAVGLQNDPELTGFAAEKNVAIATPTTLMLALKTIANLWQVERRNRNADAIAERAGRLYDKFVGFVEDMKSVGERINQAQTSYAAAMDKLSNGKGNLVKQVERLKEMGAKTGKSLPPELLDAEPVLSTLPVPEDQK